MPLVLLQLVPQSVMSKLARKLNAAPRNVWAPVGDIGAVGIAFALFVLCITIVFLILRHGVLSVLSIGGTFGSLILSILSLHLLALSEGFMEGKKLIKIKDGWWMMMRKSHFYGEQR